MEDPDSPSLPAAGAGAMEEVSVAAPPLMVAGPSRIVGVSEGEIQRLQNGLEGLSTSIKSLKDELGGLCSSVVDLSEREDPNFTAKCWMKQVGELCHDTEDYFDEVMHSGAELKILEARARYASERRRRYNIDPDSFSKPKTPYFGRPQPARLRAGLIDHGPMDELKNFLDDDDKEKQLKVASLVGPEGVGKTTLANRLYHKLGAGFECQAFVRVSPKPDMRRLLTTMFIQIHRKQPSCRLDAQDLIDSIARYLLNKRYLIVIDDLWTTSVWDIISGAFPNGNCCSRIITTTQNEDVAMASCSYQSEYRFKMMPLSPVQAQNLFLRIVFGSEGVCPQDLEEVSYGIIKKCGGLPLAVVIISSLVPREPNFQQWLDIQDYLPSTLKTNPTPKGMKEVVSFIYNNLRPHMKTCLLYLSMYPAGYTVRKDDLVKQWVAECFLGGVESQEYTEETAAGYFDELVRRGMLQPVDSSDDGEVLSCTLHYMVHNLIVNKSMEENFIITVDYFQSTIALPDKVRRLSVQFGAARSAHIPASIMEAEVRSLAFFGFFECVPSLVKYRLLRVLILHIWADQDEEMFDLAEIRELHRLRYLKIECNISVKLPEEIQGLQYLETLEVDATIAAIPSDIGELSRLSTLKIAVMELATEDYFILQELPALIALSLYVWIAPAGRRIVFGEEGFTVLRYFKFTCTAPCLVFERGAMPKVERLKLRFDADKFEQYDLGRAGFEHLLGLKEISAKIGVLGADESDSKASLLMGIFRDLPSSPIFSVQTVDRIFYGKCIAGNEEEHQTKETQDAGKETDYGTSVSPETSLHLQIFDQEPNQHGIQEKGSGGGPSEEADIRTSPPSLVRPSPHNVANLDIELTSSSTVPELGAVSTEKKEADDRKPVRTMEDDMLLQVLGKQLRRRGGRLGSYSTEETSKDKGKKAENDRAYYVVGLAKTVVEGALTKVHCAIKMETKLRQRAQRDLAFITGEFEMMRAFLNIADNDKLVKNSMVMTWVSQVRELAYAVEDCIDSVDQLNKKPSWMRLLLPSCMAMFAPVDQVAAEIEQLKARVEYVSQRNTRYGLISGSGPSKPNMQPHDASTAVEGRDATKRQQGLREDLTQLITKKDSCVPLQVISVWGGDDCVGTTSMIRKAYDDPEICRNFTYRAWVKLMRPFNAHEFIRCLMTQFYANSSVKEQTRTVGVQVLKKMEATQEYLLEEFDYLVIGKRYLVVLEDLSNMVEWDAIRMFLPDNKNGSRIIVSTQQVEVASLCIGCSYQVSELKLLSEEHSIYAFFGAEASQDDGDKGDGTEKASSDNNDISIEHQVSTDKITISRKNAASEWMKNYPLIGRDSEMNKLREYINTARYNHSKVISVRGICGVGKSALVRNLFCDTMLNANLFHRYSWVDVSHPFNLRDFCQSLLLDLYSESLQSKKTVYHGTMGSKDPIKECRDFLEEHDCFVVIDDLQTTEDWDLIRAALVSQHRKCIFVVITTEASIAMHCADKEDLVFNVHNLKADAAFDIFKKEVERANPYSRLVDLEDGKLREIIKKCGGLPKVIVAIAGLLASKTVTVGSTNDRFMQTLDTSPVYDSLRSLFAWMHSYLRTCPDSLKPCMFYMQHFPRDRIRRSRLVRRWIAEGYSRASEDKSAEENGEAFFSKLLEMSIIQQPLQSALISLGDTRMAMYQVNGFFYEYIISQQLEDNLVFELGGSCTLTGRTGRHLIIRESWVRDKIVFESIDFSRLRSLTVFGEWKPFFISESMRLLRVLDVEDASGVKDDDIEQIVKMFCRLKFLSLRGCRGVYHLPRSLGDLRQLQSLDVRHTSIGTLPANIIKLQKLQYFRAGSTIPANEPSKVLLSTSRRRHRVGVQVPGRIGKLTALHTLGVVNIGVPWGQAILKELRKLTQLRKLGVSGINRKNGMNFFSAISDHHHLESLSLRFNKDNQGYLDDIFLSCSNLQSLKLYGPVDKLPVLNIDQLSNLSKLDLEMSILTQDDMKLLSHIPELLVLRISVGPRQDGELCFDVSEYGHEVRFYQKVKFLQIASSGSSLYVTFGSQAMQSLELLKVDCSSGSAYRFSGLDLLYELREVLLAGTDNEAAKADLQSQLADHRNKPVIKLGDVPQSS